MNEELVIEIWNGQGLQDNNAVCRISTVTFVRQITLFKLMAFEYYLCNVMKNQCEFLHGRYVILEKREVLISHSPVNSVTIMFLKLRVLLQSLECDFDAASLHLRHVVVDHHSVLKHGIETGVVMEENKMVFVSLGGCFKVVATSNLVAFCCRKRWEVIIS